MAAGVYPSVPNRNQIDPRFATLKVAELLTERQDQNAKMHFYKTGRRFEVIIFERKKTDPRVICEISEFMTCVPFFARYEYEVLILTRRPSASLVDLGGTRRVARAAIDGQNRDSLPNHSEMRMSGRTPQKEDSRKNEKYVNLKTMKN
jgi:hypothetical protein